MAKILTFKRLQFNNPYRAFRTTFKRQAKNLPKREAAFVRKRARSIMRKAPSNPKSSSGVHGHYQAYKRKTYERRVAKYRSTGKGPRPGRGFWRKGLYSPPGKPPYHHGQTFNLRYILFRPVSIGQINIPRPSTAGGQAYAYVVGPVFKHSKWNPTPIPQLHEFGGKVKLYKSSNRGRHYYDKRNTAIRMRRESESQAIYAPRPYMKPSGVEARTSALRKSPNTYKAITSLGGTRNSTMTIKGRRIY